MPDFLRLDPRPHYRPGLLPQYFRSNQQSIQHHNQHHSHYDLSHGLVPNSTKQNPEESPLANQFSNSHHRHRNRLFYSGLQSNLYHPRRCNLKRAQVQHRMSRQRSPIEPYIPPPLGMYHYQRMMRHELLFCPHPFYILHPNLTRSFRRVLHLDRVLKNRLRELHLLRFENRLTMYR